MRKTLIMLIFLVLLLPNSICGSSEVIVVDQDESQGDFNSIQKAINQAEPDQIIKVMQGTYKENLVIEKPVRLKGISENQEKPVIVGKNKFKDTIVIRSDTTIIKGFKIENPDQEGVETDYLTTGITIQSDANIITHNTFKNNVVGIYLQSSQANKVYKNEFTENDVGVYNWKQTNMELKNNNITNNYRTGLLLGLTENSLIENNQIKDNKIGIVLDESYENLVRNNTITVNKKGFWIDEYSGNNHIYLNDIKDNTYSVSKNKNTYQNSENSQISDNTWNSPFKISYNTDNQTKNYLGNYWSKYEGKDKDNNIVGDTPYTIEGEELDQYPLMRSKTFYLSPEDYNTTKNDFKTTSNTKYLFIYVKDQEKNPVTNVNTTILNNNITIQNRTTNYNGLAIYDIKPGYYNITLQKNNQTLKKPVYKPRVTKGTTILFEQK